MDDFDSKYLDMLYRRDYPLPPPPDEVEKPAAEAKASKPMTASDVGMVTFDSLAGLLKGAFAQALGLPGDVDGLVEMLTGKKPLSAVLKAATGKEFATTEEWQNKLPSVVPAGNDPRRQGTAESSQLAGEFLPVAPIGAAKAGVKAVKSGVKALAK